MSGFSRFLHNNGLLLVYPRRAGRPSPLGLADSNEELRQTGLAALTLGRYLHSGHLLEVTFEN